MRRATGVRPSATVVVTVGLRISPARWRTDLTQQLGEMTRAQAQYGVEPFAAGTRGRGVRAYIGWGHATVSKVGARHHGAPELPSMAIPAGEATHVPRAQGRSGPGRESSAFAVSGSLRVIVGPSAL